MIPGPERRMTKRFALLIDWIGSRFPVAIVFGIYLAWSDAGSYAPVTVLVDERAGGVHLSYARMGSLLAPYEHPDGLEVTRNMDIKVEDVANWRTFASRRGTIGISRQLGWFRL